MRRPTTPTLFPYTTLFRSETRRPEEDVRADLADVLRAGLRLLGEIDDEAERERGGHRHHLLADPGQRQKGDEDRKSTRLNSSHRCISYAVFCLKKKKKKQT